jgi:3-hydroxyisobutyrate dehydrogenase-like beta-hydroxyacid dehydrogenase
LTAEALVLGAMAGLDPALVHGVIAESSSCSRMLKIRVPMMGGGTAPRR